jgi:hypothetical protein
MKIIQKGKVVPTVFRGECENCHCKIECEEEETTLRSNVVDDAPLRVSITTPCPTPKCGGLIIVTKYNPSYTPRMLNMNLLKKLIGKEINDVNVSTAHGDVLEICAGNSVLKVCTTYNLNDASVTPDQNDLYITLNNTVICE